MQLLNRGNGEVNSDIASPLPCWRYQASGVTKADSILVWRPEVTLSAPLFEMPQVDLECMDSFATAVRNKHSADIPQI
jgi:hypothetical protein